MDLVVIDLLHFALLTLILALSDGAVGTVYPIESESMPPNFRQGEFITVIPLDDREWGENQWTTKQSAHSLMQLNPPQLPISLKTHMPATPSTY